MNNKDSFRIKIMEYILFRGKDIHWFATTMKLKPSICVQKIQLGNWSDREKHILLTEVMI